MSAPSRHVAVIGAGAWGTALAVLLAGNGHRVTLWTRDAEAASAINANRENARRLPGVRLDPAIAATADLADAAAASAILLAVPAQQLRDVCVALAARGRIAAPAVICAKGIERGTLALMSEVVAGTLPDAPVAVLSGPSFAADVVRGLPTAVTLAAEDEALARNLSALVGRPAFRPYASSDIRGVEIGGAVKNVLAIAAGIVAGRKLGASANAALIARGFAEMVRLGAAMGGRAETLAGLSGLGDLVLTCSSPQSRNYALGFDLGRGLPLDEALAARNAVSEGAFTAAAAVELAGRHGVEMPIAEAVNGIVSGRMSVDGAIAALLARPLRDEGL